MGGLEAINTHLRGFFPLLKISFEQRQPQNILFLGAHCDDIEIGCGGTVIKLVDTIHNLSVDWVVFSSEGRRAREALESAHDFLKDVKKKNIIIKKFKNSFFPYVGAEIKKYFEGMKRKIDPDVVFTHYRHDLHQDHRLISELTWNTFRDHLILEYEIPKFDGDLGAPNFFVHLDEIICRAKTEKILKYFKSQNDKGWFTEDTLFSVLRLRGVESNSFAKYAEGFYCRKIVL